jgi:hypothetical protein
VPMKSQSKSQWACIRQNIGIWQGSFTQFSPEGEQLKDTPSVLTLKESEPDKKMQLVLERSPQDSPSEITEREFCAPGPAPYIYFFESGAFAQGSAQWASFGQFGAEMSIKVGDRRVRFVIMYDSTYEGTSTVKYITLIRETQTGGTPFSEPMLTIGQLIGEWIGNAEVLHATMSPMSQGDSHWQLSDGLALSCQEQFDETVQKIALQKNTQAEKRIFLQEEDGVSYQFMGLPNGAYCLIPQIILKDRVFRLEVGWLRGAQVSSGERFARSQLRRSRLIRYYDKQGIWTDSALIEDRPSL